MTNPLSLAGRSILITGASAGIGRSTAGLVSELGARVTLVGRNATRLEETLRTLTGDGQRNAPFDLQSTDAIADWFSGLVTEQGPFDGLVHSAGIGSLVPLRVLTVSQMEDVMRINVVAAMALTKAFSRKRAYQPGTAAIVFVASVAGLTGAPARSAYSASKGALIAFARSAALELAKTGIRVNCVAPAYVKTEMFEDAFKTMTPEQMETLIEATQPLGLGTPLDVAHSIAFLLADTARWITGSVLAVDGGYTAQ
jgi:NAD(P)-dependent dehydrogenase (short-subunit alcohol dehydrogenase family)